MSVKLYNLISIKKIFILMILVVSSSLMASTENELLSIKVRGGAAGKVELQLEFSQKAPEPKTFSMDYPAAMVFDFLSVKNKLSVADSNQKISVGVARKINFVETEEKLRMVVDVDSLVPYSYVIDGNKLILSLENDLNFKSKSASSASPKTSPYTISAFDFRRGDAGEGRLIIDFNDSSVPVDFREENNEILVEFRGGTISDQLVRKFDVKDFGTPIHKIMVQKLISGVLIRVQAQGFYDKIAYQLDDQFVIEVKPLKELEASIIQSQKVKFTGEKISLNFQNIEVRAIIQLMADFTGLNIVTSDTVTGSLTLRLDSVPWDQALDFILKSQALSKRESGNIILIAPNEEITLREQAELEAQQQVASLAPLFSEFIQVNYAKASDMVKMLKDEENSMLSSRGQVSVDERTNTLLLKDTEEKIYEVKKLLERLDIPVKQVMIEAQIVQTKDNFGDALGIRFTGAATPQLGGYQLGVAPTYDKARAFANDKTTKVTDSTDLFFNFSESSALGKLGLALARLPGGTLLDLELQASESEEKSKIIARPKLLTLDQQTASIETGQDIPYITQPGDGASPTVTFKKAVIRLEVTPQITPDGFISMALQINQDKPGVAVGDAQAPIDTTNMTTNVLVENGETVVLGGIFNIDDQQGQKRIPYLNNIPLVGRIFRSNNSVYNRTETLIFITPKIVASLLK